MIPSLLCGSVLIASSAVLPQSAPTPSDAGHRPFVTNTLGMKLVLIEPGSFVMGSPADEPGHRPDETPHRVTLTTPFYLGVHEVTQAQWRAVMADGPSRFDGADRPVENISWEQAVAFCEKLSERAGRRYRLPTEAEWEYACRAATTTPFSCGHVLPSRQANFNAHFTASTVSAAKPQRDETTAVGTFAANGWGLHDMHANVWEWCGDWYGPYTSEPVTDPIGPEKGFYRVLRGGAWDYPLPYCRSARRAGLPPVNRVDFAGLRVVLEHESAHRVAADRRAAAPPADLDRSYWQLKADQLMNAAGIPRRPFAPSPQQQDQGFVHYWLDPTVNFHTNEPPSPRDLERLALIRTAAGEDEPVLLGVWGLRDVGRASLWVTGSPFDTTVYVAPAHPSAVQDPKRLDQLGAPYFLEPDHDVPIISGQNAFFYINLRVPANTAPGNYEVELLLTVSGATGSEFETSNGFGHRVKLPVAIEVLPITLPRADIAYGLYFRTREQDNRPRQYVTDEMMMRYYRDMARHGHTSATPYIRELNYDPQGRPRLAGTPSEVMMQQMRQAGLIHPDIPIMWLGGCGGAPGDRTQRLAFARALRAEFEQRRWPEPLIYGPDEPPPTGERVDATRVSFSRLDHFRPALRIVTAITPEAVWVYPNDLDVWVVHSTRHVDETMHEFAAAHGAELWSYDCAHRGTNPTWNRYYAGLYTWAQRLKGNFLWCYADMEEPSRYYTYEANRDARWAQVLPSRFGPLPSVGWEARREGIEDYRYIRELERACRSARGPRADEARKWLQALRQRVLDNVRINRIEMPDFGPLYHWDWADLWTECPLIESHEFAQIRDRVIGFLLELSSVQHRARS